MFRVTFSDKAGSADKSHQNYEQIQIDFKKSHVFLEVDIFSSVNVIIDSRQGDRQKILPGWRKQQGSPLEKWETDIIQKSIWVTEVFSKFLSFNFPFEKFCCFKTHMDGWSFLNIMLEDIGLNFNVSCQWRCWQSLHVERWFWYSFAKYFDLKEKV